MILINSMIFDNSCCSDFVNWRLTSGMTPGSMLFQYAFGGNVIFLLLMYFLQQVALIFSIHLEGLSKLLHSNDMTQFNLDSIFWYSHHKFDHRRYQQLL